jgi:hypothetical protein
MFLDSLTTTPDDKAAQSRKANRRIFGRRKDLR